MWKLKIEFILFWTQFSQWEGARSPNSPHKPADPWAGSAWAVGCQGGPRWSQHAMGSEDGVVVYSPVGEGGSMAAGQ